MPRFTFRQQPQQMTAIAQRRLEIQDIMSSRREEEIAGKQELEAMKEFTRLEQVEFKIRQQIAKQKQVASAQREIAELDPERDPHYQQKFAEVMSRHPMAQDNKFLNEAFTDGAKVNYRVAQHQFTQLEEGQKQAGKEELAWIKASSAYAAMGGDPSAFTNKDGEHDWNALNAAHAKAVQTSKEVADKVNTALPITKTVTKEGGTTITREAPKPAKPDLTTAQKIEIAKLEGTHAGQMAQQQFFQKQVDDPAVKDKTDAQKNLAAVTATLALSKAQMDAVHKAIDPSAPLTPPSNVAGAAVGIAPTPTMSAVPTPPVAPPPAAAPADSATPPQHHIDYLVQNPHLAGQFDAKYGSGASAKVLQRPENQPDIPGE